MLEQKSSCALSRRPPGEAPGAPGTQGAMGTEEMGSLGRQARQHHTGGASGTHLPKLWDGRQARQEGEVCSRPFRRVTEDQLE